MNTYEVTLSGWNGNTDATDNRVKWINAPTLDAVHRLIARLELPLYEEPKAIGPYTLGEGVDAVLDEWGDVIQGVLLIPALSPLRA
jgi:hypothetical protein